MAFEKKFGTIQRSKNKYPVSSGSGFATQDSSFIPQSSPLTVGSTEIELEVPENAYEMVFLVSGGYDVLLSEITGMARSFLAVAGMQDALPVADIHSVFLRRANADDSEINFYFKLL